MSKIRNIKKGRVDLTDYLIHFTRINDNGLSAFEVLKLIVKDGYLKTDWSVRKGKRTVFGKLPAICLSETPLYGFVDYVAKRKEKDRIDCYGIAFTRTDMFKLGARTVIYGYTKYKAEEKDENGNYFISGFPEDEQYRYVLTTDIDIQNDWMHEREWRWTNWNERSDVNGLPIWLNVNGNFNYDCVVVIVDKVSEKEQLLDLFREVLDKILSMDRKNIERRIGFKNLHYTCILTLEDIEFKKDPYYRIEDAINNSNVLYLAEHFKELDEYHNQR